MTQRQRKRLLYAISSCFVLLSLVLWTAVVAKWHMAEWDEAEAEEGTQSISLDLPASLIEEQLHFEVAQEESTEKDVAAIDIANTSAQVEESIQEKEESELDQWELSQAYALSIPSINVQSTVYKPSRRYWDSQQWSLLEDQMQVGLTHGAVAYPHSSEPGRRGSLIVAGHSSPPNQKARESAFGHLFARLPELTIGDEIIVHRNGAEIKYAVEETKIVPSDAVSVLSQDTSLSSLKLITCFPVGTTKDRLLVTAVPVG